MNSVLTAMKSWRNHILIWVIYVLFKTYLNISASSVIEWGNTFPIIVTQLLFLLVKVPLVYFYFYRLGHFLEARRIRKTHGLMLAMAFVTAAILMSFINHWVVLPYIFKVESSLSIFNLGSLVYHSFNLLFVVGIAMTLKLFSRQFESQLRELTLKKEKTESELRYLKGQINPHFLFNTLNNIYSLARNKSSQTPEVILKLSKLMRFMLQEASNPAILLRDELALIEDYIALEKLRYTDRLQIEFSTTLDNPNQQIAPLLLIHFVENAFKHGASESRFESSITICIELKNGTLHASIVNTIGETVHTQKEDGHIGLTNVKKQLELLYPRHKLIISEGSNRFNVELTIPLA